MEEVVMMMMNDDDDGHKIVKFQVKQNTYNSNLSVLETHM